MTKKARNARKFGIALLLIAAFFAMPICNNLPTAGTVTAQAATTKTKPAKVKKLRVSKTTKSSVTIRWKALKKAKGYQVRVYKSGKLVKKKTTTKTKLKVSGLTANTKYTCKVRAYVKVNGKKVYGKQASVVATPTNTSANTYTVTGSLTVDSRITRALDFTMLPKFNYGSAISTGTTQLWASSDNHQSFAFDAITFNKAGTYEFEIWQPEIVDFVWECHICGQINPDREHALNHLLNGEGSGETSAYIKVTSIQTDTRVWQATITVEEKANGKLSVSSAVFQSGKEQNTTGPEFVVTGEEPDYSEMKLP